MSQPTLITYNKIGPVYIITNNSSQSFLSVTGSKEKDNNWHYSLQLNDINTNAVTNKKEIAVIHDKPMDPEQIIGRLGNTIWILADSLVGYDVHSLEPVVTEALIVAANPFMNNNFARYTNSYLLDEGAQVMYIGTENGDRYKLYPAALTFKPDNGINEHAPDDFNYEIAAGYKLYDRYEMKAALTCIDTLHNMTYILGSKTETGYVLSYFGTAIFPDRDESRQLTIVPWHADGEKLDVKKHPPLTGKKSYYRSGFLQNKFTTTAWKNNKEERIIMYQGGNTGNATLCIALVDKDGTEKWATDTRISQTDFTDYLLTDHNLLLWFKASTGQTIVINIDLENGQHSSYGNPL